jgi:hypothetical protein
MREIEYRGDEGAGVRNTGDEGRKHSLPFGRRFETEQDDQAR